MNKEKLNKMEKNKILKHFKKKIPKIKCPLCKSDSFALLGHTYHMLESKEEVNGGIKFGGKGLINIHLICKNCGYDLSFNSKVIGLKFKQKEKKK